MSQKDAALKAGYSRETARTHSTDLEKRVKMSLIEEFDRAGATDHVMAKDLTTIARKATKEQTCTIMITQGVNGKLKAEEVLGSKKVVPDLYLRKATWDLIAELKKHKTKEFPPLPEGASMLVVLTKEDYDKTQRPDLHPDAKAKPGV